ncbi:MAG: L-histidine N(alpha)-methyltransferase [Verrucomicrobia bacterium]|nr:L-histidine N(alpha)-methyltransferase [Verrucomicrobiota bacterium]
MNEVFVIFPYSEPYESLYRGTIAPIIIECGLIPIRADEVPGTQNILDKLKLQIRSAELVIVEASTANPNVFFEFGLALNNAKEIIALAEKDSKLPVDTRNLHHLRYSQDNKDKLRNELKKWIESTVVGRKRKGKIAAPTALMRGEVFDDFVDATFLLQTDTHDDASKIKRVIREGALMPSQFLYGSERGALRWLELCNDPHYEVFHDSARFIEQNKDGILEACGADFLRSGPDYVSLGPGNAQKDKSLITSLIGHARDSRAFYYPLDISILMLSRAVQTIASETQTRSLLRIKAIRSDFRDLKVLLPVFDFRDEPNLFALLGNTLGNMSNEGEFLRQLHSAMSERDRAIVEVRLVADGIESPGGSLSKRKSFNFTPLETVGVKLDESKLSFRKAQNLSVVHETQTLVGEYRDFELDGQSVALSALTYIHHYKKEQFRKALETSFGFKVEQDFPSERNVLFVLSKMPNSPN